jgi:flagellar biosynthesis chaperone FliJ
MDQQLIDKLQEIRHKHITALTEADKVFLCARQSYLGKRDKAKYAEILNEKPVKSKSQAKREKVMKDHLAHPAAL